MDLQDSYDVVCVGGGLGGLAGAATAVNLGKSALVLESTPLLGGVASYSFGSVWVPQNHIDRARPEYNDSPDQIEAYLAYIGCEGVSFNEPLRAAYLERGPGVIEFFAERGVRFVLEPGGDYFSWAPGFQPLGRTMQARISPEELGEYFSLLRDTPFSLEEGILEAAIVEDDDGSLRAGHVLSGAFLHAAIVKGGAHYLTNARVVDLVRGENGAVGGVVVEHEGERRTFAAGRVLLAAGGYGWAPYAAHFEGLPAYGEQAPPIVFGEGMEMAARQGAKVVRAGNGFFSVGFRSAVELFPATDVPLYLPMVSSLRFPHCFVVNREGRRFSDETFSATFQSPIREYSDEKKAFKNVPFFFVCDDRYRQNGYPILGLGRDWPTEEFTRADSLGELGDKLGFDGAQAQRTADRFNEFARSGVDEDFGRGKYTGFLGGDADERYPNPTMGELSEAPFWGVELTPVGAGISSHGLLIDEHARVLDWSDKPIPGLYATGNTAAFSEMPYGYQGGFANGRNIVYAYFCVTDDAGA